MQHQHNSCAFSNAILSSRCGCVFASKECLAEKEFAACKNEMSAKKCNQVYDYLRKNSEFAIDGVLQNNLTVAQQNKIRIGGLLALNQLIFNDENVENVSQLVTAVLDKYQQLENIPLAKILPKIAHFKIRKK